jgi:enterochelin esterase family protein
LVYRPPGYRSDRTYPLAVLFDADMWARVDIAATFDNLIADGRVPPMIVAGIESGRGPSRWRSLTSPAVFEPFVLDVLLAWLHAECSISDRPADTVLIGQSLGGIAAAHLGRTHPDRFGTVVAQSPALWWPGDADGGLSGAEVIAGADATGAPEPTPRYFIEAGTTEGDLLAATRTFRDTVEGAGGAVRYREYEGGHDVACWRGGIADGLIEAWGVPAPGDQRRT